MERPNLKDLQQQVDEFNARCAVGQACYLRKDNGEIVRTATRSRAQVLSGHSAVVWLDGIPGCYLIDRVTPITGEVA